MRRRNPLEELEQLFDRMSRQFEEGEWPTMGGTSITVDIAEHRDEFVVTADLPGYERDDISLSLLDGSLRIDAAREDETEEEEADDHHRYLRRERSQRSVSRSIRLPQSVDEEAASANYRNGVLTVTLPKTGTDETGRQIDIE